MIAECFFGPMSAKFDRNVCTVRETGVHDYMHPHRVHGRAEKQRGRVWPLIFVFSEGTRYRAVEQTWIGSDVRKVVSGATRTRNASKSAFDAVEMLRQNVSSVRIFESTRSPIVKQIRPGRARSPRRQQQESFKNERTNSV